MPDEIRAEISAFGPVGTFHITSRPPVPAALAG
jgi:hypothetical protein